MMCFNCLGKHVSRIVCDHSLVEQIHISPVLTEIRCAKKSCNKLLGTLEPDKEELKEILRKYPSSVKQFISEEDLKDLV